MSVARGGPAAIRPSPTALFRRLTGSPWPLALLVFAVGYARALALTVPAALQRLDLGMEMASVIFTERGLVNFGDFYMPQGLALGIPGIPPDLLGLGVAGHRATYCLFVALAITLPVVIAHRFQGFWVALVVALLCLPHDLVRYSLCWCGVLGGVVLLEALARRRGIDSLPAFACERPRALVGVSAAISLSGWARMEGIAFGIVWAGILALWLRGRQRWVQAAAAIGLALLPVILIVVSGGLRNLADWIDWSRTDFNERRSIPVDLGTFPDYARAIVRGDFFNPYEHAFIYAIAALAVLGAVAMTALWRRTRTEPAMALGVVPLLGAAAAMVIWTSAQRWGVYATASLPIFAAALAVVVPRSPRGLRAGALVVGTLGAFTLLGPYRPAAIRFDLAVDNSDDSILREQVKDMAHMPLPEWASLNALRAQWKAFGHDGENTLATTLHNDAAVANDPIVHWLLRAGPAAYPTIYDPGYSDRDRIQREAVDRLCASHAAIVQTDGDYPDYAQNRAQHGSRRMDVHIAWNTRIQATAGFYRIRVLERQGCSDPYAASAGALRARQRVLLSRGDVTGAGALGTIGIERAQAAHRRPALDDVATASLGGFYVPDAAFPPGDAGASLRSLRDGPGSVGPGVRRRAVLAARDQPPEVRAALDQAWRLAPDGNSGAVVAEMRRLLREQPGWPVAVDNLTGALGAVPAAKLARLAGKGANSPAVAKARLDAALRDGDPDTALETAAVVFPRLKADPVALGRYEEVLAGVVGDPGCAEALKRRADALPGVRVAFAPGAPPRCDLRLP